MPKFIFRLTPESGLSLQNQLRQQIVQAIVSGILPPGGRLPSSRALAQELGIARNTVVLAYQQLLAEGHIESRQRKGLYVNEDLRGLRLDRVGAPSEPGRTTSWQGRLKSGFDHPKPFLCPPEWQRFPFSFIDGRFDRSLFPIAEWREVSRLALSVHEVHHWAADADDIDDPLLIEEIRTKILPRRGISARPDEIMITAGSRWALHVLSELLFDDETTVAMEEPGNMAMRELLRRRGTRTLYQSVDESGLLVQDAIAECDVVYVTPSHQRPTAVTLSMKRRQQLLELSARHDFVIIEDDFDCETNYLDHDFPAMRSMAGGDRVIYIAGFSRVLAPALRLGFAVAAPELIAGMRRLRSLLARHPPRYSQRTAALFLSLGHYDSTMMRLGRIFRERLLALRDALNHYLPQSIAIPPVRDGTTYWVRGPEELDVPDLICAAEARGVLVEPVEQYYAVDEPPKNVFRMGVTGIAVERIRQGVATLAEVIREMTHGRELLAAGSWLSGAELRRLMPGATFLYKTVYGDPCTIELLADGSMMGRAGYANQDRDRGKWWIENDQWCRQWNEWSYGEVSRFNIRLADERIQWFNGNGALVDSAVFVRHT